MKIAHFSDTHLGFRAFARNHPSGINQRSIDVLVSFKATLDAILAAGPDLVIHSGDLFHVVRPDNHSIRQAHRLLSQFQSARGNKPFVLCAGNHDSPKNVEHGNIQLLIGDIPGVWFASADAARFLIPAIDTEVLCLPSNHFESGKEVPIIPIHDYGHSVLVAHGMSTQALPKMVDLSKAAFDVNDFHLDSWSYVALGDVHEHIVYAPNCCYAGSTDYTTTNLWSELDKPKGWVLFDTETGQIQHIPTMVRAAIDMPVIDASSLSVDEILSKMGETKIDGEPIVRQRIINLHRDDKKAIFASGLVKQMGSKCLNYQVVCTPPLVDKGDGTITVTSEGTTLEAKWSAHASAVSLPSTVDRTVFTNRGVELLQEVAECA